MIRGYFHCYLPFSRLTSFIESSDCQRSHIFLLHHFLNKITDLRSSCIFSKDPWGTKVQAKRWTGIHTTYSLGWYICASKSSIDVLFYDSEIWKVNPLLSQHIVTLSTVLDNKTCKCMARVCCALNLHACANSTISTHPALLTNH